MSIRVIRIRVRHFMGLDDAELAPGHFSLVSSRNGVGKTSLIQAVQTLIGGGHEASLIRAGSDTAELVMDFADDALEGPIRAMRQVTESKDTLSIEHPELGKMKGRRAEDYLAQLLPALTLTPIAFLSPPGAKSGADEDRKRLTMLLSALPLSVTSQQIAEITKDPTHVEAYRFPCESQHALVVLNAVEKQQFEARTDVHRALGDKLKAIAELKETVPPEPQNAENWPAKVEALQQEQMELTAEHTAALAAVDAKLNEAKAKAGVRRGDKRMASQAELTAEMDRLKADEEREIAEIRARYKARNSAARDSHESRVSAAQGEYDQAVAVADGDALLAREDVSLRFEPRMEALATELGAAQAHLTDEAGAIRQRQIVARMEKEAERLTARRDQLEEAVEGIRSLRKQLTATLPIAGVEIKDGELWVDGLPWKRVNEARRVQIAFDVLFLKSGAAKFVCMDGGERCDSTTLRAIATEAERRGVQCVVTRVTDDPVLTVTEIHTSEAVQT